MLCGCTTGNTEAEGLLAPGGVLLADNVLWKGLVLAHSEQFTEHAPDPGLYGKPKRMLKLSESLHRFNEHVHADKRTEQVLVPLRDGLTVIRRKQL